MTNLKLTSSIKRCQWVTDDPTYIAYHDQEWGRPVSDERLLFEFLNLEGMQAGLSWLTILKKRENYRTCFDNFDAEKIVRYDQKKINALLNDPGIIRNRLKIAAIIANAQAHLNLKQQGNNFTDFIWQFVDGKPIQNHWRHFKQIPASNDISDRMAKTLKQQGFKFVGSTICYAFMQAVGMVNDHTASCFCHLQVNSSNPL